MSLVDPSSEFSVAQLLIHIIFDNNIQQRERKVHYVDRDYHSWVFHRSFTVGSILTGRSSLGRRDRGDGKSI